MKINTHIYIYFCGKQHHACIQKNTFNFFIKILIHDNETKWYFYVKKFKCNVLILKAKKKTGKNILEITIKAVKKVQ